MIEAVEYIRSGALGRVIFARAWETAREGPLGSRQDSDPPPGVDYDMWLGPAPQRPFNPRRYHYSWRWFFDYGTGDLGNDGVHLLDLARWALGVDWFSSVSCSGGHLAFDDVQEWPDTMLITYEYPGQVLTYEMLRWSRPRPFGEPEGAAVYGENGWVLLGHDGLWKAYDADGKLIKGDDRRERWSYHYGNFFDAVRSRRYEDLHQEIAQGHISSVLCHAGNIAWRTGKKLRFDPQTGTFDDAEANQYRSRDYRPGYELPSVVIPSPL